MNNGTCIRERIFCLRSIQSEAQQVVQPDTAQDNGEITNIEISIEPQGHDGQKKACQPIPPESVKPVPPDQRNG